MTIIQDFMPYNGKHCETTATGCLLLHEDIQISEPMMLGLSQGFGFIYWKMNFMNLPFIGGRSKPFDLTRVLCSNANIDLDARETTSRKKAWQNISEFITLPENPRLLSLGMNGTRNGASKAGEVEANPA